MKKIVLLSLFILVIMTGCNERKTSGKILILELPGNSTTGYIWTCRSSDENIVFLSEEEYQENNYEEDMVGVGGRYIYKFIANNKGVTNVNCVYKRSWEAEELYNIVYELEVDENKIINVVNTTGNYSEETYPVPKFK